MRAVPTSFAIARTAWIVAALALLAPGCTDEGDDDDGPAPVCDTDLPQPSLASLDCAAEFDAQAARPLDAALPGAFTIKTIVDRSADPATSLHFLDTNAFPVHQAFATAHLGWPPGVTFATEYLYPSRRFLLGSITYYEEPDVYAYELAPYDTADAAMIEQAYGQIVAASFFGDALAFHPTSEEQLARAATLPASVRVITTDELYAGISYQPLNLGETIGQVRLLSAAELADTYVGPREIAVLDRVPNDISVVAAVVTEELQTPLSHVNVLSQQRGTPNMGLRGATAAFAAHDGLWVRLRVEAFAWSVEEVSQAEADAWWADHAPATIVVRPPDYTVTELRDVDELGVDDVAFAGGKASNFGALRDLAEIDEAVIVPDGFVIPVFYYRQFLEQNGLDVAIAAMLADPDFQADGNLRRQRLDALRETMRAAPVDAAFLAALTARLDADFGAVPIRFRSSTNAEDLAGFTGAGLYESKTGTVGDPKDSVEDAVRAVWASVWNVRAFEERAFVSIVHTDVAMALLVYPSYTDETANGVAITANVFDPAPGGEDAFYVNVQLGETSVVQPPTSGLVADQLMYYFQYANQPATYYQHSSLLSAGQTVLSRRELFELGQALDAIRNHFADVYDPPAGYGQLPMDVEFKRIGTGDEAHIEIKQARLYPGRGQ